MQTSGVKRNRYAETELLFDSLANPGDEAVQHIALFRMRIAGDSMMPKYQSGDIIEFDLIRDGVPALEVGRDYFIHRKDNKGTFKRLATIEEATLTFVALNTEKYPEAFVVERTEIRRMAVAKGIFIPW